MVKWKSVGKNLSHPIYCMVHMTDEVLALSEEGRIIALAHKPSTYVVPSFTLNRS
jgi:hypothetical protein